MDDTSKIIREAIAEALAANEDATPEAFAAEIRTERERRAALERILGIHLSNTPKDHE